ncbi:MAG: hypothetical protein [Caudoviricetes sp.]|nr:MAG: hypothetical protein [Caudoviricetes sp.]
MATTPTNNSVPSEAYADLRFNAGKLDELISSTSNTYTDRLGVVHLTAKGIQESVAGALLPVNNLNDLSDKNASLSNLGGAVTGVAVFKAGTPSAARSAITAASSGANSDITSISGLSTPLNLNQGGTGSVSASGARTSLGLGSISTQSSSGVSITGGSVTGITDIAVSDGGTGASTASAARANLGAKADSGITDASSASAGQVGEVITVTGASVNLSTGAITSLCNVGLTAGDWEIDGTIYISSTAGFGSITAGNNISATAIDSSPLRLQMILTFGSGGQNMILPRRRYNLSSATNVYLNTAVSFGSGTATGQGYIFARRIR